MSNIKKEINQFFEKIEKNMKNAEDARYVKERANELISVFLDKMDKILEYHEDKLNKVIEKQKSIESKIDKMQTLLNNIEKDIYLEEDSDFDIICPYCDYEFSIEYDEEQNETECPQCHNIIELDWNGDIEEVESCYGNCLHCSGCFSKDKEQTENDKNNDDEDDEK